MAHASEPARPETIWLNARLATLADERPGLGVVERGAIAARGGRIVFAGPQDELPAAWRRGAGVVDCGGRWITPGLIDCHTHLVYAGNRAREFEMRLAGASYEEIARAGGGILATVGATRAASEDELLAPEPAAARRADRRRRDHGRSEIGLRAASSPPSASRCASRAGSPKSAASPSRRRFWARTPCRPNTQASAPPISARSPT